MFVSQKPKHFIQIADNYSLVFIIFIKCFWTTKRLSRTSTFLVSCPKGQVKKNGNVEA